MESKCNNLSVVNYNWHVRVSTEIEKRIFILFSFHEFSSMISFSDVPLAIFHYVSCREHIQYVFMKNHTISWYHAGPSSCYFEIYKLKSNKKAVRVFDTNVLKCIMYINLDDKKTVSYRPFFTLKLENGKIRGTLVSELNRLIVYCRTEVESKRLWDQSLRSEAKPSDAIATEENIFITF